MDVLIIDAHGDIEDESANFDFKTVDELDKSIDDYIKNELELRRADVTIDDYDNVLSEDEVGELEDKGYYFE